MRRRKRKNRYFQYGFLIFLIISVVIMKGRTEETIPVVKESDLKDLFGQEDKKDNINVKEKNIRVLIMGNGYTGEVHPEVSLSSEGKICIHYGNKKDYIKAGKKVIFYPDDKRFKKGKIKITSDKKITLQHLERGYGTPSYTGNMELVKTAEGIVIINELPVEEYLKAVVPSEMPASYELEALKAQAVCARSYAYRQMETYGYPQYKAHVNDSTDYQVYGNVEPQKTTNKAIEETKGQVVYYQGQIATTYYYSTSCGKTTDIRAWGTERTKENAYLKSVKVKGKKGDYEKNLPWYKWKIVVSRETLSNLIGLNIKKDIGLIKNIEVTKRGGGDIVIEIEVTGEKGNATIKTENKIRSAFGGSSYQIQLNDGSIREGMSLLPSAFFTIEDINDTFVIEGGGLGHGIGMSQNGANEMAEQGADYKEILHLFYKDIEVR